MDRDEAARHLRQLQWGDPEGPNTYEALPEALQPVARKVDRIGDDLARFRQQLYGDDLDPGAALPQVHLIAEVLAQQVVPDDLDVLPDPKEVWVRSDLEGEDFEAGALDAALTYYARGGEPNSFRALEAGEERGRPALRDLKAFQAVAAEIDDTARGAEDFGLTPTRLLEDFVRHHWTNEAPVRGLAHFLSKPVREGRRQPWEEHPLGVSCFEAVQSVQHLPAEEAELTVAEGGGEPGDDWRPATGTHGR